MSPNLCDPYVGIGFVLSNLAHVLQEVKDYVGDVTMQTTQHEIGIRHYGIFTCDIQIYIERGVQIVLPYTSI